MTPQPADLTELRRRCEPANVPITRTERGWAGHFCAARSCRFRRNTLVSRGEQHIVVSTVGAYFPGNSETIEEIGLQRYYETMAFAGKHCGAYIDADVSRWIALSECETGICADDPTMLPDDVDNHANDMHDAAVDYVVKHFKRLHRAEKGGEE